MPLWCSVCFLFVRDRSPVARTRLGKRPGDFLMEHGAEQNIYGMTLEAAKSFVLPYNHLKHRGFCLKHVKMRLLLCPILTVLGLDSLNPRIESRWPIQTTSKSPKSSKMQPTTT